ncbi:MAG: iron ABC transporter permease [Gemmatimonadota bacterium]|nr:iron ABC transporter permease [Gemmatimonadota bacterium]
MRHRTWHWWAGALALAGACILAVAVGSVALSLNDVIGAVLGSAAPAARAIVLTLRLPRVVLAALVGVALGTSGATLQSTLRNPLAEPYLLGVSGGAAVGAVAAMLFGVTSAFWPVLAFAGASVAVLLAMGVARGADRSGTTDVRVLLMAGVVVGAFANAVIMILLANVPPDTVRGALWWMMGSVADTTWTTVAWLGAYVAIGVAYLLRYAPEIDALSLGDESAAGLGVDVAAATRRAFLASALLAAATVAAAGLIGFVGLVVPHMARAFGLTRQRGVLTGCAIIGAILVVLSDLLARVVLAPSELPLGAVTAVLGVPFFLIQLRRMR